MTRGSDACGLFSCGVLGDALNCDLVSVALRALGCGSDGGPGLIKRPTKPWVLLVVFSYGMLLIWMDQVHNT